VPQAAARQFRSRRGGRAWGVISAGLVALAVFPVAFALWRAGVLGEN
jgi:hypothetical protein